MKTLIRSFLAVWLLWTGLTGPAAAENPPSGKWQGRLTVAPDKTLAIEFVIKEEAAGKWSAVVTSPDGAIKNVRAESVTFANDRLTIVVPKLSGGYSGVLRKGVFEGEWTQEGAKLPLTLKPFAEPTLTPADLDILRGEWSGPLKAQGIEVTIVLRFSNDKEGKFAPVMDVPEQGVQGWPLTNVRLDDGHFSSEQQKSMAQIVGVLKGDQLVGQWNQLGNSLPLTLKKGKYVAPARYLDLPAASRDQLKGKWSGSLNGMTVTVRFETDAQGRTLGFFDSPQPGVPSIPLSTATLAGTQFTFTMGGIGGKYSGALAGDKLTGEWTQLGLPKPLPLTLTRGK